jgi:hypothetical protein
VAGEALLGQQGYYLVGQAVPVVGAEAAGEAGKGDQRESPREVWTNRPRHA